MLLVVVGEWDARRRVPQSLGWFTSGGREGVTYMARRAAGSCRRVGRQTQRIAVSWLVYVLTLLPHPLHSLSGQGPHRRSEPAHTGPGT